MAYARLLAIVAFSAMIFTLFAVLNYDSFTSSASVPNGIITPEETQAEILRQLAELDPWSLEATTLRGRLAKVRRKAGRSVPAENPGELLAAFAALKTTAEGTTYPTGYQQSEFEKAVEKRSSSSNLSAGEILPWVERGPGNVSGRVRSIAIDPTDAAGNTWFAATVGGGVWKTTNAGGSWRNLTPEMTTYTAMTIAIAESNPDVMYVGTGMGYGRVADITGSGVWKSTDHGETWFQLQSTANGQVLSGINRLIVDPQDENTVLLCSNNSFAHLFANEGDPTRKSGIFRSIDGGESWRQVFDPDGVLPGNTDNRVQQIIATPGNFNVQYAAVNEVGVLKSTDAGVTWRVVANNFALPSDIGNPTGGWSGLSGISVRTELAIAPTDVNRLYAAVERPRGVADLYMSTDAGESWVIVEDADNDPNWFNAFGTSGAVPGAYTAGWFDNTLTVSPYDENDVILGGVNMYRATINLGARSRTTVPIAWNFANTQGIPYAHADHHYLLTIPVDPASKTYRIINANDGGVAHSTDAGVTWTQLTGMGTTQFYGVDKKPGQNVYVGGMQDNGTWYSPANPSALSPWTFATGGDGFEAVWHYQDTNKILVTQQYGSVLRSTDAGTSWSAISAARVGGGQFITKLATSKADPEIVYTIGPGGVNRSDDFGLTWTFTPIANNWIGYRPFSDITASIADPYTVWISSKLTVDRATNTNGGVHVSRDGALSFTDVTANLPLGLTEPSAVETHPTDPATAYLLFATPGSSKILRTEDYGNSWQDLTGFANGDGSSTNGFPDVGVFSLLVMPYNTDIVWAGTEIGLFESTDGGNTWQYADNGFPKVTAFEMKIMDGQVVVATYGRGIWTVDLPELVNYRPPVVVLVPRIEKIGNDPLGGVNIVLDLRSSYDSAVVTVDGTVIAQVAGSSNPEKTTVHYDTPDERWIGLNVTAWKDGRAFLTPVKSAISFPTTPQLSFASAFQQAADRTQFLMNNFSVTTPAGFGNSGLHTSHPYPANNVQLIALLKSPIIVAENRQNATLEFDEVVLVEEGVGAWPNPNFFDYCIVEGTKDGCTWVPLTVGYDSRANASWSAAFQSGLQGTGNSTAVGNESLYARRIINLHDGFAPGDVVLLRWRLESDQAATAWGWAIDNITIQLIPFSVDEVQRTENIAVLSKGPNPFRSAIHVAYQLGRAETVQAEVFDVSGRKVSVLVHGKQEAGVHALRWDGRGNSGEKLSAGIYVIQLSTPYESQMIKVVFTP